MSIFHFPIRKRMIVTGLSLLSLGVVGVVAFGQEPPENEIVEEVEVLAGQDEKAEPQNKREQETLRKQREALMKQREALDDQLAEISRKLGEPVVRINSNINSTLRGNARAFTFNTKPFMEMRGKVLEETKVSAEARRRAMEELRKSMRGQNKEVAEEMKRAIEELERAEKSHGDERRAFRFYSDANSRLKSLPALPNLPDLPEVPNMQFRFDDKNIILPRNLENNKEFETSMRRFEQRMQAWQKQFEARMKDWQKQMEDKNDKKP